MCVVIDVQYTPQKALEPPSMQHCIFYDQQTTNEHLKLILVRDVRMIRGGKVPWYGLCVLGCCLESPNSL